MYLVGLAVDHRSQVEFIGERFTNACAILDLSTHHAHCIFVVRHH